MGEIDQSGTGVNGWVGDIHNTINSELGTGGDVALGDERRGRILATSYGLQVTGLLDVLVQAKQNSLIQSVKPLVDRLIDLIATDGIPIPSAFLQVLA